MDGQSLVVNGDAIAAAWQKTVTTMRTAGVVGQALMAAESIGNNFLQFRRDRTGEGQPAPAADREADQSGQKSFLSHPVMRDLNALIGDLNMAQTPLEMRRQMARVNQALDNMRETLPPAHQGQFEQYREEVNDKMRDRLARLQFERQQQRRGGGSGEPIPEREARGQDLPTRDDSRQPVEPRTGTEQEKVRAKQKDANKQKARQSEEQDRKTQRSNDNDYER
ncbi:hypothetical protein X738_29715 [Mesorhizobium sp. LNHC209A00]|nr:hypothetical protein X738_29715 [Mesorhizobium sp. LNHC209A00]